MGGGDTAGDGGAEMGEGGGTVVGGAGVVGGGAVVVGADGVVDGAVAWVVAVACAAGGAGSAGLPSSSPNVNIATTPRADRPSTIGIARRNRGARPSSSAANTMAG